MSAPVVLRLKQVRFSDYDANGWLSIQLEGTASGTPVGIPAVEAIGQYGVYSRPPDPEVAGGDIVFGGLALELKEGEESYCFALHDPRLVPGFPQLLKGETIVYGPAFNFTRYHADGRISSMCTADGTPDGQMLSAVHGPDGWSWVAQWGQLRNDSLGFHYQHISGATFDCGGISGLPGPLAALGSYFSISAAVITFKGTTVQLGTGSFQPAAKALTTLSVLAAQAAADSALAVALTAIQAALMATNPPVGGASAAPVTAAINALSAAVSAISGAATTLPAASVQVA